MAAYQKRQRTIFSTVKSEGAILPMDLLQRISDPQHAQVAGLTPDDYHLSTGRLYEAINQTWSSLLGIWQRFQRERKNLAAHESGTRLTRERWLLPLFKALDYGQLQPAKALLVGERSYAISHAWQHVPIHLVSWKVDLDRSIQGANGARRSSPHSLLQELLNHAPEHLWGMVSNGLSLRILRNNVSLTRQAYVEFDLEEMFAHKVYPDFVLLWLLCHQSRVECEQRPADCWLERWSREAHATGTRALDELRTNVEQAISQLGSGFLSHPANGQLRNKLSTGTLSALDYYNQLLRLVYRLLVLFVAEDRDILFLPDTLPSAKKLYKDYYSTEKLRAQADRQLGTRHADLYYGLKLVMEKLGQEDGCPELGLPAFNGFLFSHEAVSDLKDCQLANYALLAAVRYLGYTTSGRTRRIIDYKNLGSEELGSVYESLLELHPVFHLDTGQFELASASGNARKTTGSYYTPTSLITSLLDSALDPVLNEAASKATVAEAEAAILKLKICDPACGSGHFLVAAAHRIAKRLAAVRTGDEEPSPQARRHALREIVGRCIYGVDINLMAVELCKVSLWMEAIEPGKPLSFLDAHIQCGNSLLGATPALLKAGIPDAAFEPSEDDDKKICSEFKKKNKVQRTTGQRSFFTEDLQPWNRVDDLASSMQRLDDLSDNTVTDVRRKQNLYTEHLTSDSYRFGKLRADAWCTALVWKKVRDFAYPITEEVFRNLEENPRKIAQWMKDEIERLTRQYQFFHWHLAFPDVFHVPGKDEVAENEQAGWSGGFDVVLGNPPFLGGVKISGIYGDRYRHLLTTLYDPFVNKADLCAAFVRRAFDLIKRDRSMGLVVTNSIGQGGSRETGLATVMRHQGVLTSAWRFIRWESDATIEVNLISVFKGQWQRKRLLDGTAVPYISSRLDDEPEAEPLVLSSNTEKAFQGDIPRGDGFLLNTRETERLLAENPRNQDCIYPYLNGKDFNSHPQQRYSRHIICFHDWPLQKAAEYPSLLRIVEKRVKPEREQVKQEKDRLRWWLFNSYRQGLRQSAAGLERILVRSRISDLHMLAFVPTYWICSEQTIIFTFDDYYHFALLQSNLHEIWVRRNASTMRTDVRYTTDCFDTFPFPQNVQETKKRQAESIGHEYYALRQHFMRENHLGLTGTYNLFHDPDQEDSDIAQLRKLHMGMDRAILACYSWEDIDLKHHFYRNSRGQMRYTIADQARREVLTRLLALNQKLAAGD